MDQFDIKLLAALQKNGRLTNQELAEKVGLSPSQCSRRRAALEESGIISGYFAQLSEVALGLSVTAIVHVSLANHSGEHALRFHRLLDSIGEIQEAYTLTGESDYLLKIVVKDLQALARLLSDVLLAHDVVQNVRSFVVLDKIKQTRSLPLYQYH